jgi:hypothetical protein
MRYMKTGALFVVSMSAMATAHADPSPALDRVGIWLGGYYPDTRATLSASSDRYDIGENKLRIGDGHDTVPRVRLDFLIGDSQGLAFDYFSFNRDRRESLDRAFDFGGNQFDLGADVKGRFELDFGSAAYRWWLGSGNSVFGVGLGAAYYRLKVAVSGNVIANGESASASARYDEDAVAPLLTLGWRYAISDTFRIYADASGIKKNGGNLEGHAYNGAVGLEWFPIENIGIAAEYAATRIKLDHSGDIYDANLDVKLDGPAAYLRMRF